MYYYLPLEKSVHGPLFEQTGIPFTQGCIVPILVEIKSTGSGEEDENEKSLRQGQQQQQQTTDKF